MIFYLNDTPLLNSVDKSNIIVLVNSSWDDWFTWSTVYHIHYYDSYGNISRLGATKIGETNMHGKRRPALPETFDKLDETFFSIGQDASYYENLNAIGEEFRFEVLTALRDIAFDPQNYEIAKNEYVTNRSLLRDVSKLSVEKQFRRLAQGIVELTPYDFTFILPRISKLAQDITLEFHVVPKSNPPTNIHVIIGRNGVGKTHLFNNMLRALLGERTTRNRVGYFTMSNLDESDKLFANVVSVSFSAFDEFQPISENNQTSDIKFSYIGLKRISTKDNLKPLPPKSPDQLKSEFVRSVKKCIAGAKNSRWIEALKMLETDPIFAEAEISQLAKIQIGEEFKNISEKTFHKLSSGHKIVLLTITKLVETLEEKSLVFLDEPEAYLHPPLLSAFIRALSELLTKRNAVAIIGTHSPVVLQEVPQSCVWKLRRQGVMAIAERLETESFGENVGLLTQEVFGLEVTDAGFHTLLNKIASSSETYEEAIQKLGNQLGMEGRAILRNLLYNN